MTKFSNFKKISILLFLLMLILACNLPTADDINVNSFNQPNAVENNLEIQQINDEIDHNFEGTQTYHVNPLSGANNVTECKPGYEFGDRWTSNSIMRFNDEDDWDRSQIEIEAGENNVFTYQIVIKEKPNTFCRLNEQNLVECVYLDTDGYTVRVFNDPPYTNSFQPYLLDEPKTCYAMVFESFDQDQRPVSVDTKDITVTLPPDVVNVTLWGPIPAMPVTSNKTGQTYPNGAHEALWDFQPKSIENWMISLQLNTNEESITGNFSGTASYNEEDPLYVIDGKADIIGALLNPKYTSKQDGEVITISIPIRMNFIGNVYEPNQFAANGSVIDYLVYHDVDFDIRVMGTLKIILSNNETARLEIEVNDCENSQFSSTNEGAELTKCSVHLVWDDVPLE